MTGLLMLSQLEIKTRIRQLLNGSLSIDRFDDWLTCASWNMHLSASRQVQQLVGTIELCLAERDLGHLREDEFRRELQGILDSTFAEFKYLAVGDADSECLTLYSEDEPRTMISGSYPMSISIALDPDGNYVQAWPEAVTFVQGAPLRIPQTSQPHRQDRYNMSKPQTPVIQIR